MLGLAFLGLSAIAGAIPMMLAPQGGPVMPLSLLRYSPFHSFLIPAILLLTFNGLLALWILRLVVLQNPHAGLWTAFQGCILLVWLIVECWMLRSVIWLHYVYAAVALALIAAGVEVRKQSLFSSSPLTDTPPAPQSAPGSSCPSKEE